MFHGIFASYFLNGYAGGDIAKYFATFKYITFGNPVEECHISNYFYLYIDVSHIVLYNPSRTEKGVEIWKRGLYLLLNFVSG